MFSDKESEIDRLSSSEESKLLTWRVQTVLTILSSVNI